MFPFIFTTLLGSVALAGKVTKSMNQISDAAIDAIDTNDEFDTKDKYNRSTEDQIAIFQRNLANIRFLCNIKTEDFANIVKTTRQSISHLDTGKVKMSPMQCIAWTSIIEKIANRRKNDVVLQKVVRLFLYDLDRYSDEEIEKYEEVLDSLVSAKKAKLDRKTMKLIAASLPPLPKSENR